MPERDDDDDLVAEAVRRTLATLKRERAEQQSKTVGELYLAWVDTLPASVRRRGAIGAWKHYISKLVARAPAREFVLGDLPWPELDRELITAWMAALRATKTKKGTPLGAGYRDQIRIHLQSCFGYHIRETRLVHRNPFATIAREETEPKMRLAYATPEMLEVFRRYAHPLLTQYLQFIARTGLRRDEARLLRKDQIDHVARELMIPRKKKKGPASLKRVLLTDEAYEQLVALARVAPGEFIFANPRDPRGGPIPGSTLSRWFSVAREKVGPAAEMLGEHIVIHGFRHGFSVGMMDVPGVPIQYVAEQLGHANTQQLERRYARLRGPERERFRKLMGQNPLALDVAKNPPKPTK